MTIQDPQDKRRQDVSIYMRLRRLLDSEQIEQWTSLLEQAHKAAIETRREQMVSLTFNVHGFPVDFTHHHSIRPIPGGKHYMPEA
jgi:hypothetical protein